MGITHTKASSLILPQAVVDLANHEVLTVILVLALSRVRNLEKIYTSLFAMIA